MIGASIIGATIGITVGLVAFLVDVISSSLQAMRERRASKPTLPLVIVIERAHPDIQRDIRAAIARSERWN